MCLTGIYSRIPLLDYKMLVHMLNRLESRKTGWVSQEEELSRAYIDGPAKGQIAAQSLDDMLSRIARELQRPELQLCLAAHKNRLLAGNRVSCRL